MGIETDNQVIRIIFISAALGERLMQRAEIERKSPADLAGEFIAANMSDVRGYLKDEDGGALVGQNIRLSRVICQQLDDVAAASGERDVDVMRACLKKGLSAPVNKSCLN